MADRPSLRSIRCRMMSDPPAQHVDLGVAARTTAELNSTNSPDEPSSYCVQQFIEKIIRTQSQSGSELGSTSLLVSAEIHLKPTPDKTKKERVVFDTESGFHTLLYRLYALIQSSADIEEVVFEIEPKDPTCQVYGLMPDDDFDQAQDRAKRKLLANWWTQDPLNIAEKGGNTHVMSAVGTNKEPPPQKVQVSKGPTPEEEPGSTVSAKDNLRPRLAADQDEKRLHTGSATAGAGANESQNKGQKRRRSNTPQTPTVNRNKRAKYASPKSNPATNCTPGSSAQGEKDGAYFAGKTPRAGSVSVANYGQSCEEEHEPVNSLKRKRPVRGRGSTSKEPSKRQRIILKSKPKKDDLQLGGSGSEAGDGGALGQG